MASKKITTRRRFHRLWIANKFAIKIGAWFWSKSCREHHDDVIKWKHFPRYWPFLRGIHRSPVNSPHKGQWRGALMFSLICAWIHGWVNNGDAGDLRHHSAHYDVTVMWSSCSIYALPKNKNTRKLRILLKFFSAVIFLVTNAIRYEQKCPFAQYEPCDHRKYTASEYLNGTFYGDFCLIPKSMRNRD